MAQTDKLSYINTLIFTLIAGVISLALLCILLFPIGKKFLVFVVSVEIGILTIIAFCIYKIATNESYLRRLRDSNNIVVNFEQCGDYYVKNINQFGKEVCTNNYVVTDETNTRYVMKIWDAGASNIPGNNNIREDQVNFFGNSNANASDATNRRELYALKELATSSNLTTFTDKCKPFYYNVPNFSEYQGIPWTYAKSRCQSFQQ